MTKLQRKSCVGIGAIIVAAFLLTGIAAGISALARSGSLTVQLLALIPEGIAVAVVLMGFLWVLEKLGDVEPAGNTAASQLRMHRFAEPDHRSDRFLRRGAEPNASLRHF